MNMACQWIDVFVNFILPSTVMIFLADCAVQSTFVYGPCPISPQQNTTCNGLPRTVYPVVDDRPVYYNMSGRQAIDLISRIAGQQADCYQNKTINTLSIRYESSIAFRKQAENAVRIANQLSYLLTRGECGAERSRTPCDISNGTYDHYLYSLVRNTFSIDKEVMGAGIIFRKNALDDKEYFAPYSLTRNTSFEVRDRATKIVNDEEMLLSYLQKRAKNRNLECFTSLFAPKKNETHDEKDVFLIQPYVHYIDGLWGRPYFECYSSKKWLVPYMAPFFKLNYTAERKDILDFM